jgi:hypothetical protein
MSPSWLSETASRTTSAVVELEVIQARLDAALPDPRRVHVVVSERLGLSPDTVQVRLVVGDPPACCVLDAGGALVALSRGYDLTGACLWLLTTCPGCGNLVAQGVGHHSRSGLMREVALGAIRPHTAAASAEMALLESTTAALYEHRELPSGQQALMDDGLCRGVGRHA